MWIIYSTYQNYSTFEQNIRRQKKLVATAIRLVRGHIVLIKSKCEPLRMPPCAFTRIVSNMNMNKQNIVESTWSASQRLSLINHADQYFRIQLSMQLSNPKASWPRFFNGDLIIDITRRRISWKLSTTATNIYHDQNFLIACFLLWSSKLILNWRALVLGLKSTNHKLVLHLSVVVPIPVSNWPSL